MDLSLLMQKNFREFSEDMSEIRYAHDEIMNIRQLIWEGEATLNLRIKFEKLGLEFNNKMTNKELMQQMNELDSKLMLIREHVRAKSNGGVGYFNEDTKYENGLTSEFLKEIKDRIDLSLLNDKENNSIISMPNEYIEQAHNEIMNLRQLIWFQDDKIFRAKVSMDGIEDGEKLPYSTFRTDYFDKLDELDLKLMEIRKLDRSKQKAKNKSNIDTRNT